MYADICTRSPSVARDACNISSSSARATCTPIRRSCTMSKNEWMMDPFIHSVHVHAGPATTRFDERWSPPSTAHAHAMQRHGRPHPASECTKTLSLKISFIIITSSDNRARNAQRHVEAFRAGMRQEQKAKNMSTTVATRKVRQKREKHRTILILHRQYRHTTKDVLVQVYKDHPTIPTHHIQQR